MKQHYKLSNDCDSKTKRPANRNQPNRSRSFLRETNAMKHTVTILTTLLLTPLLMLHAAD